MFYISYAFIPYLLYCIFYIYHVVYCVLYCISFMLTDAHLQALEDARLVRVGADHDNGEAVREVLPQLLAHLRAAGAGTGSARAQGRKRGLKGRYGAEAPGIRSCRASAHRGG
jgi:hypothetical protein